MAPHSYNIRRITISAVFLSLSLVTQTMLSFYIPFMGQNAMRVGIAGVFTVIPALLFGPVYGAAVYGLADILGYLFRPMGAYLPLMTAVAVFGGFLRGILWKYLNKSNNSFKGRILPLIITLMAGGLAVTTLNTLVLRETVYDAWKLLPFAVVWLPRMLNALVTNAVYIFITAFILNIYYKIYGGQDAYSQRNH